ncbi:uncharacterized protein [Drosophila suzukii]|uniref:DUF5641 domain-containing protein n=1 Tax=Drosophila suzukii TaxID=28584 RepID=A0ABM4TXK8_DROSZ
MREYINLGHMREVPPEEITTGNLFFLPHHPVLCRNLRVVFDGSFRDANADIVKMFRQIWVNEKHRNYQKIVWREDPSDPIKHFQLCTVTYGTSCAPFLAVRVLEQLAVDHQDEYPNASKILLEDFYVDDVLTGSNNEDELRRNRDELIQLMSCANLELGKWVSNTSFIQKDDTNAQSSPVKVLGLYWDPGKDILTYNIGLAANPDCTKRQVLSDVSRIFDPLGLLAPIVIQFKIIFQKLWLLNLGWDDPLPTKLGDNWLKCREDLGTLQKFQLPRFVANDADNIELHGFSDASTKAYAAVVYSRVTNDDGSILVSLVAAKTRNITVFAWSDSSIVLSWLSYAPAQLKTFVGNRTSEILDTLPRKAWRHVDSKSNPADCASRGLMAADLIDFHLWWNGPLWLRDKDQYLVKLSDSRFGLSLSDKRIQGEVKSNCLATVAVATQVHPLDELIARVSSWLKLVHIVAYVKRFIQRTQNPSCDRASRGLTFEEIKAARIICIKHAQRCFDEDYQLLLAKKPLRNRSQLVKLAPIIDENDLLRVGGRLHQSQLSREAKHPVLLPKTQRISKLILEHEHRVNLHPGVSSLFVIVRQRFWIIGARNLIRRITHDCLSCFRLRCVKLHLRRVTGNSTLTFEQMRTLLAQISAVINSRPLCYTSDTEDNYLSPAHFLIGRPLTTVPDPDLNHIPVGRLGYWQSIQASRILEEMASGVSDYCATTSKWTTSTPNLSIGDVVLVKESNTPPASWHIARVMETYPGKDNLVRAVKLKTSTGEMIRPVTKIAVLPSSETVFQGGPWNSIKAKPNKPEPMEVDESLQIQNRPKYNQGYNRYSINNYNQNKWNQNKKQETQTTPQNNPQNKREPTGTVNHPANKTMRLNNIEEDRFLGQNPEIQPYVQEKGVYNHEDVIISFFGELHRINMIYMVCDERLVSFVYRCKKPFLPTSLRIHKDAD